MSASAMVHVRVDEKVKNQATETVEAMGLSLSEAIRMFLTRMVSDQGLPFDIKVPSAKTRAAMVEARAIGKARFKSAEDLIGDLEKPRKPKAR